MEQTFNVQPINIWFTIQSDNSLRLNYSGYSTGSTACYGMEELKKEINAMCGAGSYLVRDFRQERGYALNEKGLNIVGQLTFHQDYYKNSVLDAAFRAAKAAGWDVHISTFFVYFADMINPMDSDNARKLELLSKIDKLNANVPSRVYNANSSLDAVLKELSK